MAWSITLSSHKVPAPPSASASASVSRFHWPAMNEKSSQVSTPMTIQHEPGTEGAGANVDGGLTSSDVNGGSMAPRPIVSTTTESVSRRPKALSPCDKFFLFPFCIAVSL